jgi:hypothetical protein
MRLAPGLLSFVFPLGATIGNPARGALIALSWHEASDPATRISRRHADSVRDHDDFGVNLTLTQPVATALQQKVSD